MIAPTIELLGIVAVLTLVIILCFPAGRKISGDESPQLSPCSGSVVSVSVCSDHAFSKPQVDSITLLAGLGVEGDAHCGVTVQHRSRLHIKPPPPNLRQVHLLQSELFGEFQSASSPYFVKPGDLGEKITTSGLDLLSLGVGTRLHFLNPGMDEDERRVNHPVVTVTGLRNPCPQISRFQKGLQEMCLVRNSSREIMERKAGIMATVDVGGVVRKAARIMVDEPDVYVELPCV